MLTNRPTFRKNNLLSLFMKNEQGAILLPFLVFLPIFIGLLFLSFEISLFLQKKAKLSDAIEQATLALTVENNDVPDVAQTAKNSRLVNDYARAYLPSESFSVPVIDIIKNSDHLEYNSKTTMSYSAKFLDKTQIAMVSTKDNGAAKKDIAAQPSESTDVVFVLDYSTSMNWPFNKTDDKRQKIDILRDIFQSLNSTIFENKKINTIGFIPFSWGTKTIVGRGPKDKYNCHFPFVPKKNMPNGDYLRKYSPSNLKPFLTPKSFNDVKDIAYGRLHLDQYHDIYLKILAEIENRKSISALEFLDRTYNISKHVNIMDIIEDNIDYDKTINSISKGFTKINTSLDDIFNTAICLKGANISSLDISNINNINNTLSAKPSGGTLVSSGILAANEEFNNTNNNRKKLMVILSDGEDSNDENPPGKFKDRDAFHITQKLIGKGMCESIAANKITMAFIAIGYVPEKVKAHNYIDWKKCVGENNFYEAHNAHQLEAELREILGEKQASEVGRNTPKH